MECGRSRRLTAVIHCGISRRICVNNATKLPVTFVELFNADLFGNLRRCQGFLRSCTKEINTAGHEIASQRITAAIATMRRYNKFRVPYFQALLAQARKQPRLQDDGRQIVRRPGNPMLRYVGGDQPIEQSAAIAPTSLQESLKL